MAPKSTLNPASKQLGHCLMASEPWEALNLSLPRLSLQRSNLWSRSSGHSAGATNRRGVLHTRLALRRAWGNNREQRRYGAWVKNPLAIRERDLTLLEIGAKMRIFNTSKKNQEHISIQIYTNRLYKSNNVVKQS